jgi:hypothetical protein
MRLKDPKQIDDIVAYLKQFDSTGKKVGIVPAGESSRRCNSGAAGETGPVAFRRLPDKRVYNQWLF